MCESELDRLYEEEMLTILCVHGRLSLHPHVLTDVCAGLQARPASSTFPFQKVFTSSKHSDRLKLPRPSSVRLDSRLTHTNTRP